MTDERKRRQAIELLWAMFRIVAASDSGVRAADVQRLLAADHRVQERIGDSDGDALRRRIQLASIAPTKAGWLRKEDGLWTATSSGRAALDEFGDAESFCREARRLSHSSRPGNPSETQVGFSSVESRSGKLAWHSSLDLEGLQTAAIAYAPLALPRQEPESFRSFLRRMTRFSEDPGLLPKDKEELAEVAWVSAALLGRSELLTPETVRTALQRAANVLKTVRETYAFPGDRTPYLASWEKALMQYAYDQFRATGKWPPMWGAEVRRITVEPKAVVSALPRQFVNDESDVVSLTMLGILRCEGHDEDEALAVRAFGFLQKEVEMGGATSSFDIPRLQSGLGISELEAVKVIEFFHGTHAESGYQRGRSIDVTLAVTRFVDFYHLLSASFGGYLGALRPPPDRALVPTPYVPTRQPHRPNAERLAGPVDYLIVTALKEELDSVLARLPGYQQLPIEENAVRPYFYAEVQLGGGGLPCRVVVAPILKMGRVQAALATARAIDRWLPRIVLLVGIAGGVKGRVNLGDVLMPEQVADFELQKLVPRGPEIRWQHHRVDPRLHIAAQLVDFTPSWAAVAADRPKVGDPKIGWGVVATGDKVVAAERVLKSYAKTYPQLDGIEMEAGGVAAAAFSSVPSPGFFMVRGVSDMADSRKNKPAVKKWRRYASEIAAECALHLVRSRPITP